MDKDSENGDRVPLMESHGDRDSFPHDNATYLSADSIKKKDKKKKKRQSKEVVRERKRARHASEPTDSETLTLTAVELESKAPANHSTDQGLAPPSSTQGVLKMAGSALTNTLAAPSTSSLESPNAPARSIPPTSSSTIAFSPTNVPPKTLPRMSISSLPFSGGLVPRQVSRPKPSNSKPGLRKVIATTATSASISTTLPTTAMPSISSSTTPLTVETSKSETITAVTATTATTETSTGTYVFRAKDIREKAVAAALSSAATSHSAPFNQNSHPKHQHQHLHTRGHPQQQQHQHQHYYYGQDRRPDPRNQTPSGRESEPLHEESTVTTTKLIRAKPIVVTLEKNPERVEFPYGNYPSYYEKRRREQSGKSKTAMVKDATTASSSAPRIPSLLTKSLSVVVMGSGYYVDKSDIGEKTTQNDHQQRQTQHFRTSAPSVLFPAPRSSSSSSSLASSASTPRTVQELAKFVDLRLEFLEPTWFRGKRVLDIGCNAGLLTVFIAMHYGPQKIEGVDIDPSLIGKAQNFVFKTFSQISQQAYLQEPELTESSSSATSAPLPLESSSSAGAGAGTKSSSGDNGTSSDPVVLYQSYFPKALQRMHGSLPIPVKTEKTQNLFPHNIELRITDWINETEAMTDSNQESKNGPSQLYDAIIGFSLTKWIHLHNGDEGLKKFFKKIYRSLNPGGIFLMEPQSYNTYKKRSKLTKTIKENYKAIKFMPDQFEEYLLSSEVGFQEVQHLGQSQGQAQNFNRPIILFRK